MRPGSGNVGTLYPGGAVRIRVIRTLTDALSETGEEI